MRMILVSLTSLAVSFSAFGNDGCTKQINGYVAGLEVGSTLAAITAEQRKIALEQIAYIKKLRTKLSDCDVIEYIPKLKKSRDAVKFASEQAKQG